MRAFLVLAILALAAVLAVGALVFRSERAIAILKGIRKVGWGYVIAMVVLTVFYLWRDGF